MTAHRSSARRAAALAATATAALVLAACGSGGENSTGHGGHGGAKPSTSASQQQHNAADVAFAQGMIPHHRQAVTMAELAETRAGSPEVKELAKKIKNAQAPEIEKLSGWLRAWGEQVPAEGAAGGHAAHGMAGMMTAEQMEKLRKSSGEGFDEAFLSLMIEHHQGAVEMARTEQAEGTHRPAGDMADAIIATQTAEITEMKQLLDS